jgi:CheY-like chemotaxis protein
MYDASCPKILYIEDNLVISLTICLQLRKLGFQVIQMHSGEAALCEVRENIDFDLLLSDIDLGKGMNGIQTAREILKMRSIPVLFISALSDPQLIAQAENLPQSIFISKNVSIYTLNDLLRIALAQFYLPPPPKPSFKTFFSLTIFTLLISLLTS